MARTNRTLGQVQCRLIIRGKSVEFINQFMLRFFGKSKAKDGEYTTTTRWYMSDLRKKGFDIPKCPGKRGGIDLQVLIKKAKKYGVKYDGQ